MLIVVFGCNETGPDSPPVVGITPPGRGPTITILAPTHSATVINLNRIFPAFRSVTIDNPNSRTTLFGGQYIKYLSGGAEDSFEITVIKQSYEVVKSLISYEVTSNVTECADREPFQYARISGSQAIVVNLLNNPEFCEYDVFASAGEIGIAGPKPGVESCRFAGGLFLELCECGSQGDNIIFTYVPPEGFNGRVSCKYYAHAEGDPEVGYPDRFYDPAHSNYFSEHQVVIDVVN